ncbi:unnamed protein product [Durusdinium trenchii]|uniref:CSD domain-containing protein n=1 Tax=Durusdinium trenchii TaxID=1381693 RepID=A0ABP0S4T5_9DINO
MILGKVRSFKDTWGFLRCDRVQGDVFVGLRGNPHLTSLAEGDQVLFDLRTDPKGKNEAVNVQPLITATAEAETGPATARATPAARYTGRVRSFSGTWGFITSSSFEGDLFVGLRNNPQLSVALTAGDEVDFAIRRVDGKQEAIEVRLVNGHAPTASAPPHAERASERGSAAGAEEVRATETALRPLLGSELQGSVRSFRDPWGFVVSEYFEGDLYLHKRHNPNLGPVQAGDPLRFQVSEEPASQFQAIEATVISQELEILVGQRLFGWVKSYKDSWGLLSSLRFPGDLFVGLGKNPQLKSPLRPGDGVVFNVEFDEAKGKFQATNVTRTGGTVELDVRGATRGHDRGAAAGRAAMAVASEEPLSSRMIGERCSGVVKSFRDDWGFVNSDAFEGDLFLHLGSNPGLTPLQPGEVVDFTISSSGEKLHATDVRRAAPAPRSAAMAPGTLSLRDLVGQLCAGTVRKFSGEWGFINSNHFEGDLFVGLKSNPHLMGPLLAGDVVEFKVVRDLTKRSRDTESFEASNVGMRQLESGTEKCYML